MLRQLEEIVSMHISERPIPISQLREKTVVAYPGWALRELLMNAVMHRDYESASPIRFFWFADKIEIHNPGGLYGEARADFPRNNAYRNPIVAELLKNLGYVNRYGHGIARAQKELSENGNPELEFYLEPKVFGVTIRRAP
jgi:ATP-dependent DNA helicase RecG